MHTFSRAALAALLLSVAQAAPIAQTTTTDVVVECVYPDGSPAPCPASVSPSPVSSPPPSSPPPSSPPPPTTGGGGGSGHRGLCYNDASLTAPFDSSSQVTWAYNWASTSGGLSGPFEYFPMLWGASSVDSWQSDASAGIASGSKHLLGFNEPDNAGQSNMDPGTAAGLWSQYMDPFANQATLISPAVTNGPTGFPWLSSFLSSCSGCTVNAIALHWYASASDSDYFMQYFQQAHDQFPDYDIYITEFGTTDGDSDDINAFLGTVLPWLDSQTWIAGYAFFWDAEGFLIDNGGLSSNGQTFAG